MTRITLPFLILFAGCAPGEIDPGDDAVEQALGTTYQVGPGKPYRQLADVAGRLSPGDVVEVQGDAEYSSVWFQRNGSPGAKITIRGVRVNGRRPVLRGGRNTVELMGNHYVFEGFDVTGGEARCIYHHAHDITVRDTVVHHCPKQGILGADTDSGSLTLDRVEVHHSGSGDYNHQIYMATDETAHPGSVFRMQNCYVHDGVGGHNVKSRAERNEIYNNWIEGAYYHELELIGPDGQNTNLAREDSDVVGNVLIKRRSFHVTRFGGDATGETHGRYRFVNNTVVLYPGSTSGVFRLFDGVQSVEAHNNVIYRAGGGPVTIFRTAEVTWTDGREVIAGRNNWVPSGTTIPAQWTGTKTGAEPGFVDLASNQLRPTVSSPLVDAGAASPPSPSGYAFPRPLAAPQFHPPRGAIGAVEPRPVVGAIDIGAFEHGSGPSAPTPACAPLAVEGVAASTSDANGPSNVLDGNLGTRWSGEGAGATLTADLGQARTVCAVSLAWYRGDLRKASFAIELSTDGATFRRVLTGTSSGVTRSPERYDFAPGAARYIRLVGGGNTENAWNSVTELAVHGS